MERNRRVGALKWLMGIFMETVQRGGKKKHNLISLQLQPKSYAHMQVAASPGREGDYTEAAQRQYWVSLSLPDAERSAACLVLPSSSYLQPSLPQETKATRNANAIDV